MDGRRCLASIALLSVAIAACSPQPTVSGSPVVAASAVPPATVAATSAPISTATVATAPLPTLPSGWRHVSLQDPNLQIPVPGGWTEDNPTATLVPGPGESLTPVQVGYYDYFNDMATSGVSRLVLYGDLPSLAGAPQSGGIGVWVESGDASLEAFAERAKAVDRTYLGAVEIAESRVTLPIGEGIRQAFVGDVFGPIVEVDYLVMLPDGRSLLIWVTGEASLGGQLTIAAFADRLIQLVRFSS